MLSTEDRKKRIGKITSSTIAGCLGLHKFMTPFEAWAQITGRHTFEGNNATEIGNRLESIVLDFGANEWGFTWEKPPFVSHASSPWAGDSADALYFRDGALVYVGEAKTMGMRTAEYYGVEGTDQVPEHVLIQCYWHLIHWPEAKACLVPVFMGGYELEFRTYLVKRDAEIEGTLLEQGKKFHRDYIQPDRPPEALHVDDEIAKAITRKYSISEIPESPEIVRLAQMKDLAAQYKEPAIAMENAAKARLRLLMGQFTHCSGNWGDISYAPGPEREVTDWEALARTKGATQEDIKKFTKKTSGSRTLRVRVKPSHRLRAQINSKELKEYDTRNKDEQ